MIEQDANAKKPNVVLIFTDDQGYADLGVQGIVDDIRTPHIDSLANAGVRFNKWIRNGSTMFALKSGFAHRPLSATDWTCR